MLSASLVALSASLLALATPVDLSARQGCADVTVIFARGTTETAPIGTVVGPPFRDAIAAAIAPQTLAFNGVNYAADIPGFLEGGDPAGSRTMAQMITSTANSCPSTKIVSSGYSQGAQLVHNSAGMLSSSVASHVAAVVMFGDPDNGDTLGNGLSSRSLTFCHTGDNICQGGDIVLPPHLTYGQDVGQGAAFVAGKV